MTAVRDSTGLTSGEAAGDGDLDSVFPLVYDELRRLAHRQLKRERAGHTLVTTALVHEAWIRLTDHAGGGWRDRNHFLSIAAIAMRRILVEHARRHGRAKRGGTLRRVPLDDLALPAGERAELIVALDDALQRLAALDARQARVVECRFFGGMTEEETAAALGIGLRTAKRDWARARGWLYREIWPDAVT